MTFFISATVELEIAIEYKDMENSIKFTKKCELTEESYFFEDEEDGVYAKIRLKKEHSELAEFVIDEIGQNKVIFLSDLTSELHYGEPGSSAMFANPTRVLNICMVCNRK